MRRVENTTTEALEAAPRGECGDKEIEGDIVEGREDVGVNDILEGKGDAPIKFEIGFEAE